MVVHEMTRFLIIFILGGCSGLENNDFGKFLIQECVVVLKGLILDNFHFVRGGVLKRLILDNVHFGRMWWS